MADGMRYNGKGHIVTDPLSLQPGAAMQNDEIWPVLAHAS
jgi:hypothetical protein